MTKAEPKIRIESREELIYMLAEAAAIEHNLMACYLFASWSLKRGEQDGLTSEQAAVVKTWRHAITSVAIEEMTHLVLASNLATAIGAGPHLSRPNFPIPPGYHPSGVVIELAPFSRATLDHFIFLERPEGREFDDSTEFVHPADYHRTQRKGRLTATAQDYATVGHLYRGIRHGLVILSHHLGEEAVFCGDPASQIGPTEVSLPGLTLVVDLASAKAAIEAIIEQGEGGPKESADSHYNRFVRIRDEFDAFLASDPTFQPAFPVARNPVAGTAADGRQVSIDIRETALVLDLANAIYGQVLRCLVQAFGRGPDTQGKRLFVDAAIDMMEALPAVGSYLASLPASRSHPGVNAGMTFTMLRDVARLPPGPGEYRIIAERAAEIADHARHIFPPDHELGGIAAVFDDVSKRFGVKGMRRIAHSGR